VLRRLSSERSHADDSIASLPELNELTEPDRSLANELISGTVKRRASLDAVLAQFTKAPLRSTPAPVLEALRLAAYQLLFLDRVPAYAAVDDAVAMAGRTSKPARGFANAVLRRVAAEGRGRFAMLAEGEENAAWAVRFSVPRWLVALLRDELGDAASAALLQSALETPERCLRVNTLKGDVSGAQRAMSAAGFEVRGVPGLPSGLLYDGPALERAAPFRDGLVTPQSRGSQVAAMVAAGEAKPGSAVLDVCAAPGTKTAQIAALVTDARITAVDIDEARLQALRANLARLGAVADVIRADGTALPAYCEGAFDVVLLDAPCSGMGTLASRPDLRWRRKVGDVARLAGLQRRLLAGAARCVRPGGTLTYSVCTAPRAETVDVVDALLRERGWEADDLGALWPACAHPVAGGFLLVLPPDGGSTAFFIARLRRSV
jgi:16S rRNA (cytosine967-C5)-methyltransferase